MLVRSAVVFFWSVLPLFSFIACSNYESSGYLRHKSKKLRTENNDFGYLGIEMSEQKSDNNIPTSLSQQDPSSLNGLLEGTNESPNFLDPNLGSLNFSYLTAPISNSAGSNKKCPPVSEVPASTTTDCPGTSNDKDIVELQSPQSSTSDNILDGDLRRFLEHFDEDERQIIFDPSLLREQPENTIVEGQTDEPHEGTSLTAGRIEEKQEVNVLEVLEQQEDRILEVEHREDVLDSIAELSRKNNLQSVAIENESDNLSNNQNSTELETKDLTSIVRPSYTLSWKALNRDSLPIQSILSTSLLTPLRLHFGTKNLEYLFIFEYASKSVSLVRKGGKAFNGKLTHSITSKSVDLILSTISSISPNVRPFFYLFSFTESYDIRCNNYLKVPFYFLFTSISYLIRKKDEITNSELLISMIKRTYLKILKSEQLSSDNWDFLRKFLEKYFEIPGIDPSIRKIIYRYDPLTVSFIYNEMKLGREDEVGNFFAQVWEACEEEYVGKRELIQICDAPFINIPFKSDNTIFTFESTASKLYQMKFTDLLFGEWKTVNNLLDGYDELRKDFDSIRYDFRLRVFSLIDFELLDKSLKNIYSLLDKYSFSDRKKSIKNYFTELECFINFKCILFTRDFCLNVKKIKSSESYQSSFILITSIHNKFEKIRSKLSNQNIKLGIINYKFFNQKDSFSLKTLVKNLPALTKSFSVESIQSNLEFQELSHYLKLFDYFDHDSNNLSLLSRFQWIEFLAELKGFMDCNSEASIDGIFLHDRYKEVREYGLKKFIGYFGHSPSKKVSKHHIFSLNEKKYFFKEFIRFIIHYNQ